jgi:hypothetical protein
MADAGRIHPAERAVSTSGSRNLLAKFISPAALCLGPSLSRLETVRQQESCPYPAGSSQLACQIFFTYNILTGQLSLRLPIRRRLLQAPQVFLALVQRVRRRPCWDIGDQSSTSSEPIGNSRANYFLRPAIYVIKLVPRFELPRFDTEAANHCQLFVAAPSPNFFH